MNKERILVAICAVLVPLTVGATCGPNGDGGNGNGTADTGNGNGNGNGKDTMMAETGTPDGGDTGNGGACSLKISRDFAGDLGIHPVTKQLDSGASLNNTKLGLYPALKVLQGKFEPLSWKSSDSEPCKDAVKSFTMDTQSLMWSLSGVDVDPVSSLGGVVAIVDDTDGSNGTFVQSATGVASAEIKNMQTMNAKNAGAFAVTEKTVEELASISSKSKSDLLKNGIMLGMFLDSQGNGVPDVQVGKVGESGGSKVINETIDSAIYPDENFMNATTGADGGATSSNGVFIVPNQSLTTFGGTRKGTASDSLDTKTQQGATASDTVFSLFLRMSGSGS